MLVRQGNVVGATFHPELTGDRDGGAARVRAEGFLPQRGMNEGRPSRMSTAELWLVRHGETVGGSSTRLYGSTDLALSDVGRRQMECVREVVEGVVFDRVITSPLQRSREAAAIVHPRPEPAAAVIAAFTEIDFGDWEGLTAEEVAAKLPGRARAVAQRATATGDFPAARPGAAFALGSARRSTITWQAPSGRSLLVLHKGVVKIIVGTLLGEAPEVYAARPVRAGQSCRSSSENDGGDWRLRSACLVEHLGETRQPGSR